MLRSERTYVRTISTRRGDAVAASIMGGISLSILLVVGASLAAAQEQPTTQPTPPSTAPDLSSFILTPPAPATPRITGPRIYGQRPGRPFLFTIPATGERPMTFAADGLPNGLKLDPQTGRFTGTIAQAGEHMVTLHAKNAQGEVSRPFKI